MREIKFRAWDKENKYLIPFKNLYLELEGGYGVINDIANNNDSTKHFELMQYTGLKDKNGVEIYEGDIYKDEENMLWKVIFDNGCFMMENIHIPGRMFITEDVEIIGNIYKNPELLEGRECGN